MTPAFTPEQSRQLATLVEALSQAGCLHARDIARAEARYVWSLLRAAVELLEHNDVVTGRDLVAAMDYVETTIAVNEALRGTTLGSERPASDDNAGEEDER